jgi:hypothetical protein
MSPNGTSRTCHLFGRVGQVFPGGEHATAISHVEQYHGKPKLRCRGPLGSHQGRVFGAQRVVSAAGCEQPFPDRVVEQFPPRCAMPHPFSMSVNRSFDGRDEPIWRSWT